jgi:Ca2+-binding RTX toxin-like protein
LANSNGCPDAIAMATNGDGTISATDQTPQLIIGARGNDALTPMAGGNTSSGNAGANILIGSAGYDTYRIGSDAGQTTIYNAAPDGVVGADGEVDFGAGISSEQLWFVRGGNDLQVDFSERSRKITFSDWLDNPRARIQSFNTADGSNSTPRSISSLPPWRPTERTIRALARGRNADAQRSDAARYDRDGIAPLAAWTVVEFRRNLVEMQ